MKKKYCVFFCLLYLAVFQTLCVTAQKNYDFIDTNKKFYITDNDPTHAPQLIFNLGIPIGTVPHTYFAVLKQFEGHFNYSKYSVHLTYSSPIIAGMKNSTDEQTNSLNPINSYKSFDISASYRLFEYNKNKDVRVFHHYTADFHSRTVNFLKFKGVIRNHFDLNLGYYYNTDVLFNTDDFDLISTTGKTLHNIHLNMETKAIHIGIHYIRDIYMRGTFDGRELQTISSKTFFVDLLYATNISLDRIILYNDPSQYEVSRTNSLIFERKVGVRMGVIISDVFLGTHLGADYGFDIALYPGISGFPEDYSNVSARVFLRLSLNLLKRNGDKFEI